MEHIVQATLVVAVVALVLKVALEINTQMEQVIGLKVVLVNNTASLVHKFITLAAVVVLDILRVMSLAVQLKVVVVEPLETKLLVLPLQLQIVVAAVVQTTMGQIR